MRRTKSLENLLSKEEITKFERVNEELTKLKTKFNIFNFFEDIIKEVEWTRIFAFLLDSQALHNHGIEPFYHWMKYLSKENKAASYFFEKLSNHNIGTIRTVTEWSTVEGRRMDLLIEILDLHNILVGVVGIENKVNSGEQDNQVMDYQKELTRVFKDKYKLMVFTSPDGRESKTSKYSHHCPCLSISYKSFGAVVNYFSERSSGELKLLFNSLNEYLNKLVLDDEQNKIREKIYSKLSNPSQYVDYIKSIPLFNKFQDVVNSKDFCLPYIKEFRYRPWGGWQLQFYIDDHAYEVEKFYFVPCYLFEFSRKDPGIGDSYVIRLMIYWDKLRGLNEKERKEINEIIFDGLSIPNSGSQNRNFALWTNIWSSRTFKLIDMDIRDLENFESALFESIQLTYPILKKKLKAFIVDE